MKTLIADLMIVIGCGCLATAGWWYSPSVGMAIAGIELCVLAVVLTARKG